MAYISQEKKAQIVAKAKTILKKYGIKGTFSIDNASTLYLNISQGEIDFIGNYNENPTNYRQFNFDPATKSLTVSRFRWNESYTGMALAFMEEIWPVLMEGNWDNSDSMSDYFDIGWYCYINIGKWNKPYVCTSQMAQAA
jgi:hypothetical protein